MVKVKVKVAEASGVVLDYMVAMALGHNIVWDGIAYWISDLNTSKLIGSKWKACGKPCGWSPSNYWEHGGSIIAREQISFDNFKGHPCAAFMGNHAKYEFRQWAPEGQILIAAMRCFVVSKLGEEVEVPNKLLKAQP